MAKVLNIEPYLEAAQDERSMEQLAEIFSSVTPKQMPEFKEAVFQSAMKAKLSDILK